MKKFLCMLLALVMALSLVACGEQKQPDANTGDGDGDTTATGSVYYLNFKPESDAAWQTLAAAYTAETGVRSSHHVPGGQPGRCQQLR